MLHAVAQSSLMSPPVLSADFLLGFLESYPAAAVVFALDGTMAYVNDQGCDLVSRSKAELVGRRVQDFAADAALAEGFIARIIHEGYVEQEVNFTQSNGNAIGVRLSGVLVKDRAGKPMGIIGMAGRASTTSSQGGDLASAVQRILSRLPEARMLTVEEVAGELRVSRETVRRWVRSGRLPCVKLPRGIRIPSEVIEDLIRTNLT
jgi:excisionase family DNA binding protein/PAS domain S-box-containing protein